MSILHAFGQAIRRARTGQGWSQEELAEHADLDRSYLSAIERGERNPSVMTAVRISQALRVPLSELLDEHGDDGSPDDQGHQTLPCRQRHGRRTTRSTAPRLSLGDEPPRTERQINAVDRLYQLLHRGSRS